MQLAVLDGRAVRVARPLGEIARRLRVEVAAEDQRASAAPPDVREQVRPLLARAGRLDPRDAELAQLLVDERGHGALVAGRVRARRRDELAGELDELVAPRAQVRDERRRPSPPSCRERLDGLRDPRDALGEDVRLDRERDADEALAAGPEHLARRDRDVRTRRAAAA